MTVRAGQLSRQIELQRPGATLDADGQPSGWKTVTKVWADIRFVSGIESVRGGADVSLRKASVRIRYRAGIDASMRAIGPDGTPYRIVGVLPDLAAREYMDLVCEVVNG